MKISKRAACEIRKGLMIARGVFNRERVKPRNLSTTHYWEGLDMLPLWEKAYHRELVNLKRRARLVRTPYRFGAPTEPSGVSNTTAARPMIPDIRESYNRITGRA